MAERVDAIAVDVRDRAGAAELQIAADEHHADGVARLERTVERHLAGAHAGARRRRSGRSPARGTRRRAGRRRPGSKPDITSGVAIGRSSVPSSSAAEPGDAARRRRAAASPGRSANGRFQLSALRNAAVQVLARQRKLDAGRARPRGRAPANGAASVISAIGVMPAIGSFEKLPERVGHGADQPAVDVDRAAAHAGDDAGVGERTAFEPREDQVAARADDVLEHAEDVDLELLDAGAVEDGPADADHARPDLRRRPSAAWRARQPGRAQRRRSRTA